MSEGFFSREEFISLLEKRECKVNTALDDYSLGRTFDYDVIYDCGYDVYVKECN